MREGMGEQLFFVLPMKKHDEFLLGRDQKFSVFCNVAATMHLRFQKSTKDMLSMHVFREHGILQL